MQIAKVVPKVKTRGEGIFDYSIPPEILSDIKIGVLVLVPFRGHKVEGIVVDIKRLSQYPNLKPIISIIDRIPVVDDIHVKLAQFLADYYLEPFSKTLFENVVPPAKRILKQELIDNRTRPIKTAVKSHKYLIVADFSKRLKFYGQAINKTLARGQQIIIIVPDLTLTSFFTKFLKKDFVLLHSGLTLTQRWQTWDKIRQGKTQIIAGSNSALFSPTNNLGLIIVDQEESETYKSDQSPRFHVLNAAQFLSKITNANLLIGSVCPRVETYFLAKKEQILISKKSNEHKDITIVDMNFERSIISQTLINLIEKNIDQTKKILLVFNRKGLGSSLICKDCGWRQTCPQCDLPLTPQLDSGRCSNCEKNFPLLAQCPKCRNTNLSSSGLGTQKLKSILKEKFFQTKITIIEKDAPETDDWQIAIVTSFALKKELPNIGLVAIIDADQNINLPDFFNQEKLFATFYKFLRIGETGLIQTHLPENTTIKNLGNLDYESFFNEEIALRQKYLLPPFGRLIKLLYSCRLETECADETDRISKKLLKFSQISILGPNPSFSAKKRNLFVYQILIKYEKIPEEAKQILLSLPSGWSIEIDPVSTI